MAKIDFTTAANESYAPGLLVMVASALTSADPAANLTLHFFNGGLSKTSFQRLEHICRCLHPSCSLVNIPFDESFFAGNTVGPGSSLMCYTRLLLGSKIDAKKVIYVDSDILVLKDLAALWETDLQGKTALVCKDNTISAVSSDCPWPLDETCRNNPYFNSGFMVMDLDQWRQKAYEAESLQLARSSNCNFHDQTVLNYVLRNEAHFIASDWNWQSKVEPAAGPLPLKNYHFAEKQKPWLQYGSALRYKLWRLYYSTFVGSPTLHLIMREGGRRTITWSKDFLVQKSAVLASLYAGYLKIVYGEAAANAQKPRRPSGQPFELRRAQIVDRDILDQIKNAIELKAW